MEPMLAQIRVMPNTPCLVGASASAMCLGGAATEEDGEAVRTLFAAVGTIVKVRARAHEYPITYIHQFRLLLPINVASVR